MQKKAKIKAFTDELERTSLSKDQQAMLLGGVLGGVTTTPGINPYECSNGNVCMGNLNRCEVNPNLCNTNPVHCDLLPNHGICGSDRFLCEPV